jgi:hypothetical protein
MMVALPFLLFFFVPGALFISGLVGWAGWGERKLGVSLMGAGLLVALMFPVLIMASFAGASVRSSNVGGACP